MREGRACEDQEERDRLYLHSLCRSEALCSWEAGASHFIAVAGLWCFQPEV